jgi:hypothetical protein
MTSPEAAAATLEGEGNQAKERLQRFSLQKSAIGHRTAANIVHELSLTRWRTGRVGPARLILGHIPFDVTIG